VTALDPSLRGLGAPHDAGDVGEATGFDRATLAIAHATVLTVGFDLHIGYGASATLLAAGVLLPLWAGTLGRYRLGPTIAALTVLTVLSGLVLRDLTAADRGFDPNVAALSVLLLLSGVAGLVLLLWARLWVPLHRVVALYGLGGLAGAVFEGNLSWKYALVVPTIYLVLGLVEGRPDRLLPVAAIVVLGVSGALFEARSVFGLSLLAAMLTLWQHRRRTGPRSRWTPALVLAGTAVVIYALTTALLTGGHLGEELQERSITQIERSGSLIGGGRPEWAVTRELVIRRPIGYGVGVVPSWEDFMAGNAGLRSINIVDRGYLQNYLFGGQFRLHSVAADLWVSYGLVGLALAGLMAVALIRSLSFSLAARAASTSGIFACVLALWYLLFGPIWSNWHDVCAAVGLTLLLQERGQASAPLRSTR
jgi:hypothetical protein